MAQQDREPKAADDEPVSPLPAPAEEQEDALVTREAEEPAADGDDDAGNEDEKEGEQAAAQLGTDRYVLAGFFAAGMMAAYVIGRSLQGLWESFANKDWFSQSLPQVAAVSDEDKGTYSLILGAIAALFLVIRVYRRPDVRAWSDDVASELTKCVWPTRKDVSNSTIVVIVASAAATLYLAMLDRLWAFLTNIVYGDGS
jgi:preprotein translocase subunit SecE